MMDPKGIEKSVLKALAAALQAKLNGEDDMSMEDGMKMKPEMEIEMSSSKDGPESFSGEEEKPEMEMEGEGGLDPDMVKRFLEGREERPRPEMKGLKVGSTEMEVLPVKKKMGRKGY